PQVVDLPEQQAVELLRAQQLDASVERDYSEEVPDGVVISADRPPGSQVRHGTSVGLVVSQGPERYAVPPLSGLTLESAQSALESAHLSMGQQEREHDEVEPEGRVLRSDPDAGEHLPPDTPVNLVLSAGPAPVEVVDVTGDTQAEATSRLTSARLTVSIAPQRVHHPDIPSGSVV
ncbi:MAG: PASTA domain-containing protein, partial [Micrococcus sp.]|nr:PASTA domain-containing protein [Micrococcus sp.]